MEFKIYIQDIFIENILALDTGTALGLVAAKLESSEYSFDSSKPTSIKIIPVN